MYIHIYICIYIYVYIYSFSPLKSPAKATEQLQYKRLSVSFFVLFVVINPKNPYFASYLGLEVKPLEVYPLGPRIVCSFFLCCRFLSFFLWFRRPNLITGLISG